MSNKSKIKIFGIDDEESILLLMDTVFKINGIEDFKFFNSAKDFLNELTEDVKICIVDYYLGEDQNGLSLIKNVMVKNKKCWFIMISGQTDIKVTIDFLNTTYGGRYIEKSGEWTDTLVKYIGDIKDYIYYIEDYYTQQIKISSKFTELKNLLNDDTE